MLFVIEQSVAELFASGAAQPQDIAGMDYLAMGVAEGNHRLIARQRNTLVLLSNQTILQRRTRDVLQRSVSRVAVEGSLLTRLHVYGTVNHSTTNHPVHRAVGIQRVIEFPLRWLDHSRKIQPTVLLGENLADATILRKVAEVGTVLGNLGYLPLRFDLDHGGGSTISLVLELNENSDRPCVCIVDSDRACPNGTIGATATCVQPFRNPADYPLIEVDETESRDLENILPDLFYNAAYSGDAVTRLMGGLTQANEFELRLHVDIERGISLRQVFTHPIGSPEETFWRGKLLVVLNCLGLTPAGMACYSTNLCAATAPAPCTCILLRGNTANILRKFNEQYANTDRYSLASWLDSGIHPEWRRLGLKLAAWGCADDMLRV